MKGNNRFALYIRLRLVALSQMSHCVRSLGPVSTG